MLDGPFLIARNFDLDYSRRKECRSKVDALTSSLHLSFVRGTFIAHHTHTRIHMDARVD